MPAIDRKMAPRHPVSVKRKVKNHHLTDRTESKFHLPEITMTQAIEYIYPYNNNISLGSCTSFLA